MTNKQLSDVAKADAILPSVLTAVQAVYAGKEDPTGKRKGSYYMTEEFVRTSNRILGQDVYTISDREEPTRAREMAMQWLSYYSGMNFALYNKPLTNEEAVYILLFGWHFGDHIDFNEEVTHDIFEVLYPLIADKDKEG